MSSSHGHPCSRAHANTLWSRHACCPEVGAGMACAGAAQFGHLEVLQWARAHNCPWDHQLAEEGGHLGVLQWAVAHGDP